MTKMVEDALGGEYIVTVQPYPQTTAATKAAMEDGAEIGYTADIGMTQLYERRRAASRTTTPPRASSSTPGTPTRWNPSWRRRQRKPAKYKCLKDFSGKPVFYTTAGFMNWLNFQRMYKALGYEFKHVQIDAKTNSDALQGGTIVGSVAYTVVGQVAGTLLEGDRGAHGRHASSIRALMRSPS